MITEEAKFWFSVVQWLTTLALGLYVYVVNRHRVTTDHIIRVEATAKDDIGKLESAMDSHLDNHADRIARLEQDARHAPSHDDLKRLHRRLDDVNGELKEMRGEFHSANRTLALIHQYLLDGGNK